jgi:Ca2+-binding EF-hand superfamily protein
MFKKVDKDGNDELSNDEVSQLCMMFGETHTDKAIQEAIKGADADGDGTVNVEEFKAQILSRSVWSLKKWS